MTTDISGTEVTVCRSTHSHKLVKIMKLR